MPRKEFYQRNKEQVRKEAREWYHKNIDKARATKRRYYLKNRDKIVKRNRGYYKRLMQIWTGGIINSRFETKYSEAAEQFALVDLEKYGFKNILRFSKRFSFDLVGELNGKKTLVDVSTGIIKPIKLKASLAEKLGLPFYVLFVRPDLSFSHLMKCKYDQVNLVIPRKVIYALEKTAN